MKIDFDGLQAFVCVAELGSFVKAALQLHLTQTALTRRIQKLEGLLDTRLLDRTTRKVELTATGRDFLPQARHLVLDATRTLTRVRDKAQLGGGHFTLACVPSLTTHVLPELIRAYAQQSPGNTLRLLDASSHDVRAAVLDGQAELGIAINGEQHAELEEVALFEDPLTLLCPTPHTLQARTTVSWTDLQGIDLIVVSSFMATRMFLDYQLAQRGIRLSGHYEVQHHATAINLVAAGVGCAVLPSSTFENGDRPNVVKIPLTGPVVKRRVTLLRRKQASLSAAAEGFYQLSLRHFGKRRRKD
ncbi:LysR family transcriptional regulator [Limnohabitans sp. T6-5]|uniref:LysR family transcriptional regulator n=1 Tax=Limnohabitans sp. T6-5 TaxID=1100724 RepID=UPI000D3A6594|nr:LysR family transcriptional regulator [Limnohabitans sp. T6-5]PUE11530.1 LysR family transcriptional regulator [Limnohabitans sp. T6-5]